MLILISNDDGIDSEGIAALAAAVDDLGEVWVVAPDRERSAASNSISLDQPLRGVEIRPRWISVNGTPTDCIYLAVHHFLPGRPALVLSGINRGPNLGDDVHYSGTVAAAMEGSLFGIPSVAFSLASRRPFVFDGAAKVARRITRLVVDKRFDSGVLLNVNIPPDADASTKLAVTRLGRRRYANVVERRVDPRGRPYFWIGGEAVAGEHMPESDTKAIASGEVSLTPIRLDMTDFEAVVDLKGWEQ